jgi:phenylacetate-CoA ligase
MKGFRFTDYQQPMKVLHFHRLMREAPYWTASRLERWSRDMRTAAATHAYRSVPYYRKAYDACGVDIDRIGDEQAWSRLPTLAKRNVVTEGAQLMSRVANRSAVWAATSGSSGMPMKILLDGAVNSAAFALFWRAWSSGGYWHIGQKHAVMKGPVFAGVHRRNWKLRALEIVSARLTPETVGTVRDALARFAPRFLRGYPSSMYLFCRLLREQGLRLQLPMVISGSETLHDYQRAELEEFFGARVFNHWTHWERAGSILECDRGQLHAQEDYGHHEILDPQGQPVGPGVEGEITVTGLHNRSMPLIRYRTGDIGTWSIETCGCGQSFPVIARIQGRETDCLYRSDGVMVSSASVTGPMKYWQGIRYAQIVQDKPGEVEVRVVPVRDTSQAIVNQITDDLSRLMDHQMTVVVRFCGLDELLRSPVGKIRQFFNRIPAELLPEKRTASGTSL